MEEKSLPQIVGKNLATLRKAKGLTQQQFAEQVHYSDKSVSKWELGYTIPSVDILMDIASFYGVTVDYLLHEQTTENLEKVAVKEKGEDQRQNLNKGIILALTMLFVTLVFMSVFFSYYFNGETMWSLYIWMIPAGLLLAGFEVRSFWHNRTANVVLVSCFIWSLLLSFCVQFAFFNNPGRHIWFILIVGLPIQAILILIAVWRSPKKKKTPVSLETTQEKPDGAE